MSASTSFVEECLGYRVLSCLDENDNTSGPFRTFLVSDPRTRNIYTLKHVQRTSGEAPLRRLLHEHEISGRFHHACLRGGGRLRRERGGMRVSELGALLPFVDGQRFNRWQPSTAAAFFDACVDLADGLAHLHDRGVVHGAVAPEHVLVDDLGAPTLIGFGEANDLGAAGSARPDAWDCVRAPEVARGDARTARTDLFGLAATMFTLVAGRSIIEQRETLALAREIDLQDWHESIRRELATRCPIASLRKLLAACLEPDPRKRPVDAASVGATLRSLRGVAAVRFDRQEPGTAVVAA